MKTTMGREKKNREERDIFFFHLSPKSAMLNAERTEERERKEKVRMTCARQHVACPKTYRREDFGMWLLQPYGRGMRAPGKSNA